MKTEFGEHLKPRSQYVDEAVQMAIAGRWEEAADLNKFILEKFGPDEETLNRIGKALTELGKLKEAKESYEKTLQLNPLNLIAQKNRAKLDVLVQTKGELRSGPAKVDLNLFVEEMGKTVSTTLEDVADPDVHNKVAAGDIAELRIEGDTIVAESVRGVRLGLIEPRLARRLIKFMQGGNRYLAAVTSAEPGSVRLIIRETYQDPKFIGKPSFAVRRQRAAAEFRPYAKESLLARDLEFPIETEEEEGDEDEETAVVGQRIDDLDDSGGAADEEEETIDFSEDADDDDKDDDEEEE
ncbi:MAG: tetratricopeptide repeat protein [Chloroflexi bacterium]|nr:MAG: tetratricopeptide repeat protein [Chloroflexota bacterium]TME18617.1 MAG: tetratricopeptide repeat protein [Chloroflexota bacterium]